MLSMLGEGEEAKLKRETDRIMKDIISNRKFRLYPEVYREPQNTTIRGVKPVSCFWKTFPATERKKNWLKESWKPEDSDS